MFKKKNFITQLHNITTIHVNELFFSNFSARCVKVAVVDPDKARMRWRDHREGEESLKEIFRKGDEGYVTACDKNTDEWILENWGLLRLHE